MASPLTPPGEELQERRPPGADQCAGGRTDGRTDGQAGGQTCGRWAAAAESGGHAHSHKKNTKEKREAEYWGERSVFAD